MSEIEDVRRGGGRKPNAAKLPFSRTVFGVEVKDPAALFTAVSRVTTLRTVEGGEDVRFSVPSRDAAKVVAICDRLCYNYKIIKEEGVLLSLIRAARRPGILLGTAAAVALAALQPCFVTEVEFSGDSLPGVRAEVEASGVHAYAFLPGFDGEELEERLLALEGVAFASVTKRGTRVYVDVRAERGNEHFTDVPTGDVTASTAAAVTRVIVWSGTAEVAYGDAVLPGDVLIGAYVLSGEEKVPCSADGEVYGLRQRKLTRLFPDTEIVREYGATHTEVRLSFDGRAPDTPESPYADYVLEVSRQRNDFLLGYELYVFTFREVTYREQACALSEEEMIALAKSALVSELPPGAVPKGVTAKAERQEGGVLVTVNAQTEERIDR